MWYMILPPYLIVTASIALPGYGLWWLHKMVVDNHYRRSLESRWDRAMYQRDMRVSGDPYKVYGLETLPSEPPPPGPKKRPKRPKPDNVRF